MARAIAEHSCDGKHKACFKIIKSTTVNKWTITRICNKEDPTPLVWGIHNCPFCGKELD